MKRHLSSFAAKPKEIDLSRRSATVAAGSRLTPAKTGSKGKTGVDLSAYKKALALLPGLFCAVW